MNAPATVRLATTLLRAKVGPRQFLKQAPRHQQSTQTQARPLVAFEGSLQPIRMKFGDYGARSEVRGFGSRFPRRLN